MRLTEREFHQRRNMLHNMLGSNLSIIKGIEVYLFNEIEVRRYVTMNCSSYWLIPEKGKKVNTIEEVFELIGELK